MKPLEIHQRLLAACGVDPGLMANEQQANTTRNSTFQLKASSQPNLINLMNQQNGHNGSMANQPQMEASILNNMMSHSSSSQGLLNPKTVANFNGLLNSNHNTKNNGMFGHQSASSANDLAALMQPNPLPFQSDGVQQQQQQKAKMTQMMLNMMQQQLQNNGSS